jgi:predicted DNA-binding transcriptional regulator YafY
MDRTKRLFAIAEYLRGRRTGTTVEQLAERFDVSVRTMFRDLAGESATRTSGGSASSCRGPGSGIQYHRRVG